MVGSRNKRIVWYSIAGVVALGVIAVVGYLLLHGPAPEEVSLESAVESAQAAAETTTTADPVDTTSVTTAAQGEISGEWVVDTSIGDFSFEDATASFVGFRIQEELASIGATEAVGRTPTIDGRLVIDGSTVTEATITADMTDIVTNNSRRDNRVQDALSTSQFPSATFALTAPFNVDLELSDGEQYAVTAFGDLTIAGVTNAVEFPLEAQVVGDVVVVVGSLDIDFADWNVQVPSAAAVVSAENHGPIEMQLFFTRV